MESIGDVLKRFMSVNGSDSSNPITQFVLGHPLIVELRKKNPGLTESEIKLNLNRLYEYVKDQERCAKCPGLDDCGNALQGHYTDIEIDENRLFEKKVACNKWKQRMNQEKIAKRIKSFYVDESIFRNGFDIEEMLRMDPERARSVFRVIEYVAKTKKEGLQKKGLYLTGGFGTGKTYLMSYLLHELAKEGYTGVIVYMPDFCEDIKSMIQDSNGLAETLEILKKTDLLILDDIGAENLTPWFRDHVLGSILNYRMNRKPTFFTSNFDLEGLLEHLSYTSRDGYDENKGIRIMERIKHYTEVIHIFGFNKRYQLDTSESQKMKQ